jgi:alanyl-tRNA synthetase
MVKSSDIRETFISFFEERDHRRVASSSLVPNDPSLLLTNAGMVQFKPYFLGERKASYSRATSVQKCVRTTDIDSVGHTARHNTFFEMLGNFSFGDYYKESAIPWAWELITVRLGIDPGALWVSVYEEDDEAERIWKETPGVSADRVIRLGADDNFWDMGATGPCGPCSEILYDRGEAFACGPDCGAGCDCDRFLELWNLVFMEYDRQPDKTLVPLPKKNIDTGMGLERVAAIKQGVATIFETDLIMPVVDSISSLSGVGLGESPASDVSIKVVADHARASAFLISDGVIPSNEGRGYILRRLLRRAVRHGRLLGIEEHFIDGLADTVVELLSDVYPGLKEHHRLVLGVIRAEEERFGQTLEQGIELLREVIDEHRAAGRETIEGKTAFYLHDTLGFPLELTEEIAADSGLKVDRDGFDMLMEEQRERARHSREDEAEAEGADVFAEVCRLRGFTDFEGYECSSLATTIVSLVTGAQEIERAEGEDDTEVSVILEKTPFYAESGGQVGDTGRITGPTGTVAVEDTFYGAPDLVVHHGRLSGTIAVGDEVEAVVDIARRMDISRNHSATHLLHWALRRVLGTHAKQAGSLVTPERLRFDFTHYQPVSPDELEQIEQLANEKVLQDAPVSTTVAGREEAQEGGAIALFGEKYGEQVRVVEIGDFSKELCGGVHVDRSGRIGPIRIISESGIGAGLRRIEATSGHETLRHYRRVEELMDQAADLLKVKQDQVPSRLADVLAKLKELERASARDDSRAIGARAREAVESGRTVAIGNTRVLLAALAGEGQKTLRDMADLIIGKCDHEVVALAGDADGKAQLVVKVEKQLSKAVDARELAAAGGAVLGGGGGGRPDMAVAGGSNVQALEAALGEVLAALSATLEKEA